MCSKDLNALSCNICPRAEDCLQGNVSTACCHCVLITCVPCIYLSTFRLPVYLSTCLPSAYCLSTFCPSTFRLPSVQLPSTCLPSAYLLSTCLPSVYLPSTLMSLHITRSPRHSPTVYLYQKRSNAGGDRGLGMRLA